MQKGSHLYQPTKMYFHNRKLLLAFIDELQFKVANISQGFRINLLSLNLLLNECYHCFDK